MNATFQPYDGAAQETLVSVCFNPMRPGVFQHFIGLLCDCVIQLLAGQPAAAQKQPKLALLVYVANIDPIIAMKCTVFEKIANLCF